MVVLTVAAYCAGESDATSGVAQQATLTVSPAISISSSGIVNFGTVPDSTAGPTTLTAKNTMTDKSNMPIDVYTRVNDTNMVNSNPAVTDTITKIQFTPNGGLATDYTTRYQMVYDNWLKPEQGTAKPATWDEVLSIQVPSYTNNGTYMVTIYHAAVAHGTPPPVSP